MLRSIGKQSGKSVESVLESPARSPITTFLTTMEVVQYFNNSSIRNVKFFIANYKNIISLVQ